jgi:hypothetical protein
MSFALFVDGERRRRFDPLGWPDEQYGEPLPEEQGLVFGVEHPLEEGLRLLERITGLQLDEQWFQAARPVHELGGIS